MKWARISVAVATLLGARIAAHAQVLRMHAPIAHSNSLNGNTTISVSASPANVTVALVSGSSAVANSPITVTITLANPASTSVNVYGFFTSATAALSGSVTSAAIPTSCIYGLVPSGIPTSYTAFTQTGDLGTAGASLKLVALSGLTSNYSETDNLTLKINLASVPHLPADTYTGTLYLQAEAF